MRVKLRANAWRWVCDRNPKRRKRFVSPPTRAPCHKRVAAWEFVAANTCRACRNTSTGLRGVLGNARNRAKRVAHSMALPLLACVMQWHLQA